MSSSNILCKKEAHYQRIFYVISKKEKLIFKMMIKIKRALVNFINLEAKIKKMIQNAYYVWIKLS